MANYTYVDSTGGRNTAVNILEPAQVVGADDQTLPLEGLSKTSYNLRTCTRSTACRRVSPTTGASVSC